jgi:hypothetical protein
VIPTATALALFQIPQKKDEQRRPEIPPPLLRHKDKTLPLLPIPAALQIILDLCIPEKELAKTRSQISFI